MFKNISFIISSTFLSIFRGDEKITFKTIMQNARKSQYVYDGLYKLTEHMLKLSDSCEVDMCYLLYYSKPIAKNDDDEIHFYILANKLLYYFTKLDCCEIKPTFNTFSAVEVPILIQLEFLARKNLLVATKIIDIPIYMESIEFPDFKNQWEELKKFIVTSITKKSRKQLIHNN